MNSWIDLHALWKIVVLGLAAGAGLPALFALGLRSLSSGAPAGRRLTGTTTGAGSATASSAGRVGAVACFAVVLAAIGYGIYLVVASS